MIAYFVTEFGMSLPEAREDTARQLQKDPDIFTQNTSGATDTDPLKYPKNEAIDPEKLARLQSQLPVKPNAPKMTPEIEKAVIQKYKALPQDRKNIIKVALQHPCPNCEAEFKLYTTGRSHGICKRHRDEFFKRRGSTPGEFMGKTVDLAILSPDERSLLVYLYAIVNKRQTAKGVN